MIPSPQVRSIDTHEFESGLDRVRQVYTFSDTDVEPFLREHPELVPFLLEAVPHVERYFGSHTSLRLEVTWDPEYPGPPELIAYIYTSHDPSEAVKRLRQLDIGWFLDQPNDIVALFNFNLGFV